MLTEIYVKTCQQNGLLADQSVRWFNPKCWHWQKLNKYFPPKATTLWVCGFCLSPWCRKILDKQERVWWSSSSPARPKPGRGGVSSGGISGCGGRGGGGEGRVGVGALQCCTCGAEEEVGRGWGEEEKLKLEDSQRIVRGERMRSREKQRDRRDYRWQQPGATYHYHQSQRRPIRSVYSRKRRLKQPEVLSQQALNAL